MCQCHQVVVLVSSGLSSFCCVCHHVCHMYHCVILSVLQCMPCGCYVCHSPYMAHVLTQCMSYSSQCMSCASPCMSSMLQCRSCVAQCMSCDAQQMSSVTVISCVSPYMSHIAMYVTIYLSQHVIMSVSLCVSCVS